MTHTNSRGRRLALVLALLVPWLSLDSRAEIERTAYPGETEMEFTWWPKVTPPKGWSQEHEASRANYVNLLIPDGETYANSPVVMYTRAFYHEAGDTERQLVNTIAEDQRTFRERDPSLKIEEVAPTVTADGTKLRTFSFTPKQKGDFELVAYGREPKYVLMFCISARTREALDEHRATFADMVRTYRSKDD